MNQSHSENSDYEVAVDVIIPVLNEREMLPVFMKRIEGSGLPLHLIFIDNGSDDGTLEYVSEQPGATLIAHGENLGYGRSLVDGMKAANAATIMIIDADCEYPPEAIPRLIEAVEAGADVVYGSRFLDGGRVDMSRTRAWGNRFLTGLFNLLYRQHITDLYTGMKAMRRDAFAGMDFRRDGFEHVAELAARLSRRGYEISEVPVEYSPRCTGRSKMRHIPELLKALTSLVYFRVVRLD
jgi:glycosyltransferase involved in cell wall biosynthesis